MSVRNPTQKKKLPKRKPKKNPLPMKKGVIPVPDALLITRNSYAFIWED
jgi:hypothetical protein